MIQSGARIVSAWLEPTLIVLSLVVGGVAGVVAMLTASEQISAGFYSTIAQILPVFLVALVIEQKLVDRLGFSEDEYAKRAENSLNMAIGASVEYDLENYPRARELEESFDSQPEFSWVGQHAGSFIDEGDPDQQPDISAMARSRYKIQRRNEAIFVSTAILLLIVGEAAALGGMLQSGTQRCSPYLGFALGSTVAVVLALTLSAGRELLLSLRR